MKRRPLAGLLAASLATATAGLAIAGPQASAVTVAGPATLYCDVAGISTAIATWSMPSGYSLTVNSDATATPPSVNAGSTVNVALNVPNGPNTAAPVSSSTARAIFEVKQGSTVFGTYQSNVTTGGAVASGGAFPAAAWTASFTAPAAGSYTVAVKKVVYHGYIGGNTTAGFLGATVHCNAQTAFTGPSLGGSNDVNLPNGALTSGGFGSDTADGWIPGGSPGGTNPTNTPVSFASTPLTVTPGVVQVPSTTAVTASKASSTEGESVTFTATVTGSGGTPTGAVTFENGATTLGTATLNGSGVATLTTSSLPVGLSTITASYPGDAGFLASSGSVSHTVVAKQASTTTLTATPATAEEGAAIALATTVTGAGGTPTGTVTFKDGATAIGSPVALSAGVASASVTTLAVGARSLTAVYSGDATFATSTSAAVPVTITPKSSSISTKTKTEAIDGLYCTVLNTSTKAWTAAGPAGGAPGPVPNFTFTVTPGAPAPGIQASVSLAYDAGPAPGPLDIPAGATVPKATVQVTGTANPIVLVGPAFGAVPGYIANPTSRLPAATMTGTFTVPASGDVNLVAQSVAFDYKDPFDPSSGFTWPDANPVETFDTVCNKSTTNTQTAPVPIGFTITVPVGTEKPLPDTKPPANGALTVTGTPTAGGQVTIAGSGFKPSSPVTVGIYSAPTFVGQFQATAAGALNQAITLPGSLTGAHTIVAIGVDPAGAQFVLEAPVTIEAASGGTTTDTDDGTSASTLPQTGPGDSIPALLLGLIALQVGLVVAVRSHRALAPASSGGGRHRLGV